MTRPQQEDMQLAGIWSDDPWDRFDSGGTDASDYGHGLGFNTSGNTSKCYASLIDWKGNVYEKTQTYNKWATFRGYDGQNQRRVCYVYFTY